MLKVIGGIYKLLMMNCHTVFLMEKQLQKATLIISNVEQQHENTKYRLDDIYTIAIIVAVFISLDCM